MNGNYYQNPTFPTTNSNVTNQPSYITPPPKTEDINMLSVDQSNIENILRLNRGKKIKAYFSFTDSKEWQDHMFTGIIEEAGTDHLILSNPETNEWHLIPMVYLNYFIFSEPINYSHDYSEKTF